MPILRSQTLPFKSVTDKQKQLFGSRSGNKAVPRHTWHGDSGGPYHSCTSKKVSHLTYSFAVRGRWKFWGKCTHEIIPRNPFNKSPDL